jgi:phospholipid/cholesterol/gamma-HCH transport system substrate-binding protein
MMTTRMMEILVGVFVAIGLASLFMLAMKVSNLSDFNQSGGYTISARFENIGGLKVKSPVTVSGVRVGRVIGISYDSQEFNAVVTMQIEESYNDFPIDTSASIYTAGLLGEQYIALEPGAEDDVLANGDMIEYTQSALVLENIIGQFMVKMTSEE